MKLSQFRYHLPQELIALHPAANRDESRLLVVDRKTGAFEHKLFKEITSYFSEHDILVFNNTKVFPARLYGNKEKTGADIEVFLLRELNKEQRLWDVLVDPARKIRIGNKLYFGADGLLVAEVIDNTTSRGRTLRFLFDGTYDEFKSVLYGLGETPLPRSISRKVEAEDSGRYQTIFAKHEGAVAAPSAGLHFSRELLKRMEIIGVDFAEITLHVGLGNYRGIDVEDLTKHKVDSERAAIPDETAEIMVDLLLKQLKPSAGAKMMLIINGVGATTQMELNIVFRKAYKLLEEKGFKVVASRIQELLTVQEQAGFQMLIGLMDDDHIAYYYQPSDAPYWTTI